MLIIIYLSNYKIITNSNTKLLLLTLSYRSLVVDSKNGSDYDKVTYEQTPTVLEVHDGDVIVNLKGTFPEKYFTKSLL